MRPTRYILTAATAAALMVAMGLVAGRNADAGIVGSKHDFSAQGWAKNQICLPCHIPHNATVKDAEGAELGGPLWNHTLSTATYTVYDDTAVGGTKNIKLDTNSVLCMSCHDGTVALDSFGGGAGTAGAITGNANFGTDLGDDHPIGEAAVWPTPNPSYMVDPALRDAKRTMPLRKLTDGRLAVGCTSCHEPHNRTNVANMLWVSNTGAFTTADGRSVSGSGLCLNCHKK
jgi:hypothetical protein